MANSYIPREHWPAHDMKKLWWLLGLLVAALISWGVGSKPASPAAEGVAKAESIPAAAFAVTEPASWPAGADLGPLSIKGTSFAPRLLLICDGVVVQDIAGKDGTFAFSAQAADLAGKQVVIKEVWPDRSELHSYGGLAVEGGARQDPFTMDSHKEGARFKVGSSVFSGRATPGDDVHLFIDRVLAGAGTADAKGHWTIKRFVHEAGNPRELFARNMRTVETTKAAHVIVK